MKRIIKAVLTILISLVSVFPFAGKVHGDIGGVNWDPYYAWCIEKDGITVSREGYGQEEVYIPYGARLYVWYSFDENKAYNVNDSYFAYYGDYSFSFSTSISGKHIRPVKKVPNSEFLTYENLELLVLDETKVYEGPSSDYKKVATLFEGTTISSDYNDGMWAHIIDEDKEGWIYFNQTSVKDDLPGVIIKNNDGISAVNINDVVLYDSLKNKDTNAVIPAGSTLTYLGNCSTSFENKHQYMLYDGKNGWITDEGDSLVYDLEGSRLFAYENVILYDDLSGSKVISVIQGNDAADVLKMVFDSHGKEKYYCRYEGLEGWTSAVANCFVDSSIIKGFEKAFVVEDTALFKQIGGEESGTSISKNEEFLVISSTEVDDKSWHYIRMGNKEGWISADLHFFEKNENEENDSEIEDRTNKKVPDVMYYYVAGAFIISISTFVLIRYLNVKKK